MEEESEIVKSGRPPNQLKMREKNLLLLVTKRGATSVIRTWFGLRKSDTEQKTILCKLCHTTVIAGGGNTSNLFYHLKMMHARQYYESQKMCGASSGTKTKAKKAPQIQKSLTKNLKDGRR